MQEGRHEHADRTEGEAARSKSRKRALSTRGTAAERPAREQVKQHIRARRSSTMSLAITMACPRAADVGKRGIHSRFPPDAAQPITSIYRSETTHPPGSVSARPGMNVMCLYPYAHLHLGGAGRPFLPSRLGSRSRLFPPFLPCHERFVVSSDSITVTVQG